MRHIELEGLESLDFMTHLTIYQEKALLTYPVDWLHDKIVGGGGRMVEGAQEKMQAHLQNRQYQKSDISEQYPEEIQQRNYNQQLLNADIKMAKGALEQLEGYTALQGFLMGGIEGTIEASFEKLGVNAVRGGISDKAVNIMNRSGFMDKYCDCSEIAEFIYKQMGKEGNVIEITSKEKGFLKVLEGGNVEEFTYHQIYINKGYVYDPRYSAKPVSLKSYTDELLKYNPGGVNIFNVTPY